MMRRRKTSNFSSVKLVKAVILGQDGVGKSALTVRFLTRRYIWEYDRTMEATYRYHTEVDNDSIALDLSDTAGENTEEKLRAVAHMGDLFLVLYSITDRSSFNEAKRIGRYLKDCKNAESLCMALVGTKSDLEHLRTVDVEEGTDLSGELESTFYEISISEGVKEVHDMMHDALKHYLHHGLRVKDSLRVPAIGVRRSPSIDRKKLRASSYEKSNGLSQGYYSAERLKSKSSVEICASSNGNRSSGYNRIKELSSSLMSFGSSSDLRGTDQNHNWRVPSDEELNKGSKGYNFSKAKGPFFIQKAKGTSIAKGLKVPPVVTTADVRTVEGCNDNVKTKNPFMLNRMRKNSSEVTREQASSSQVKIEKVKVKAKPSSPSFRKKTSPTVESPKSGQAQEKPKGPFSLRSASTDKLRSSSNEKLRNTSSDKGRSTSSLSRMKEGITRSFRRKPIYL